VNGSNYYISPQLSDIKKIAKRDLKDDKQKAIIRMMAFSFTSVTAMD